MLEPTNPIPSYLNDYLYIKVPFKAKQVERAMTNWPDSFAKHLQDGHKGGYVYNN
ncbi:hypothetical protein FD09_GL002901 [Schleiferilactobacillus perolens DSM 12744]|uniref:Uncharacterized protein n=2 Tax=Schleiferilactobacillus perolens TaxID=100468 RepID=A0A0R1MWR6_9LACO|nr:hypothetical protein FD09_GL002901 [Schleiferilactobacillus perolens DSM 12744]